jgi:GNAT superfamily N-acetyltransferase
MDTGQRGLVIRQACYSDRGQISEFLGGLSLQARYLRFFTGAPPTGPAMLRILAGGDDRADVVVAIKDGVIIGHAMACDTTGPGGSHLTEIGVVVTDACQGRGIGSALMRTLSARAWARGVTAATMEVLAENRRVLTMIGDRWPAASQQRSGSFVTIQAQLPQPGAGRLTQLEAGRLARRGEERPSERLAISR